MARVITQDTFDQIVRENIEDMDMSPEEAAEDAIQQFVAQGVDLRNIITQPNMSKVAEEEIGACVQRLGECMKKRELDNIAIERELDIIKQWCEKGTPFKVLAGTLKCYDVLVDVLSQFPKNAQMQTLVLNTLISLMTGYPDLLEEKGIQELNTCLQSYDSVKNSAVLVAALQWGQECCKMHESNRQKLIQQDISGVVTALLKDAEKSPSVLVELCELMKVLTFDDDIREHISHAHEHARALAVNNLCMLCELLEKMRDNKVVTPHILGVLSALVVRNEFCEKVDVAGGITHILHVLVTYPDVEKINVQCLRLMKVLAGNDDVKKHIMESGAPPLLLAAMSRHKGSSAVAHAGCSCIAALALRSPGNSQVLVDNGAADAVVDAMKVHSKAQNVQRVACLAIRNVVSRNEGLAEAFLSLGVEDLLNSLQQICWDEAKAALRDLGCEVKFEEPFTGKGIKLKQ